MGGKAASALVGNTQKANRTSFRKGQSGNPKGRSKGTQSKQTLAWKALHARAVEDYEKAYAEVRNAMESGESWAHNIFFTKLVPRNNPNDLVSVALPPKLDKNNLSGYIAKLVESLSGITDFTLDEILAIIKTLSNAKMVESMVDKKEGEKLSFEDMKIQAQERLKMCDSWITRLDKEDRDEK